MKSFYQFLTEDKKLWAEIDHHDRNAPADVAHHVDSWAGVTHAQVAGGAEGGPMIPGGLEDHHEKVHAAAQPIRDALQRHYGDTIKAYRGELSDGKQSTGRKNILHSYTTDRDVALHFAGSPGRKLPTYSRSHANRLHQELQSTGQTKFRGKTYKKNEFGTVDIHDRDGNYVTDTDSIHDAVKSHNEWAVEHNKQVRAAERRVKTVNVPVKDVVWATDRANQKELIVRKSK